MSAKYKSPSFLLPNELNTSANTANDTGINSLYSMDFDGSNNISITDDPLKDGATNFTLSAWVKASGTVGGSKRSFLQNWNGSSALVFLIRYKDDGNFQLYLSGVKRIDVALSSLGLVNNNWNHIVLVNEYDNSQIKVYVNGTLQHTETNTQVAYPSNTTPLGIGGAYDYWNGSIDEVAIFNRALNTTEIAALYDGTGSNIRPSNLMASNLGPIAYYPLGEQAQNSGYPSATGNEWQFPNGVLQDYVMDFDDTSPGDYISAPMTMLNSATQCTISFWGKKDASNKTINVGGLITNNEGIWLMWYSDGNIYFSPRGTGSGSFSLSYAQPYDNNWHHYLGVYDGSSAANCKLYLDGNLVATGSGTAPSSLPATTGDNFQIGALGTSYLSDGQISNVAVWNTAITDANQIANIYNNGSPQTTYTVTPQNWWKLNADSVYTPSAPNYTTALDFDGSSDYITVNQINLGTTNTISFWYYGETNTYSTILGNDSAPNDYAIFVQGGGLVYYKVEDSSNGYIGWYITNVIDGNWHHFAFSRTNTTVNFYIDGNLQTVHSNTLSNNDTKIDTIGAKSVGTMPFKGKLSNVALFNSALTDSQVSTLFNFGTPETNISFDPTAWWKLNDQNAITDSSGNGHTGTNNGATNSPGGVAYVPSWKIPSALPITSAANYTTALDFGGSDYIDCGNDASFNFGTGDFTVSSWINISSGDSSYRWIFGYGQTTGLEIGLNNTTNNNLRLWIAGSLLISSESISSNTWHNLVVKRESGSILAFLDNTSLTLGSGGAGSITNNNTYIGVWGNGGSDIFNGSISNVAVYNSALTSSQVSTLYNNGTPETAISFSPISWWKLDTGGSTITDYGSAGNNGTNTGASPITSDVLTTQPVNGVSTTLPSTALQQSDLQFDSPYSNYSLSFDGTGDYIDVGNNNSLNPTSQLTLSVWVKKIGSGTGSTPAVYSSSKSSSNNGGFLITLHPTSSRFQFYVDTTGSGGWVSIQNNVGIVTNQWYHIVSTWDGSNIKMYVDGVLQPDTASVSQIVYSIDTSATIGKYATSYLNGKIDETAIWNTALTEAQVLEIYNNGKPGDLDNFSGTAPISWWRLGENAYFDNNIFTVPNSIAGAPNGVGSGTVTTMLSADAPGTYANGIGDGLAITDRVGDAPLSVANSQSYNMIPDDKVPYVPGYIGLQTTNNSEMTFDGVDDYFDLGTYTQGTGLALNADMSISAWIKTSNLSSTQVIICNLNSNASSGGYCIEMNRQGNGQYGILYNGATVGLQGSTILSSNTWYHIVMTRTGTSGNWSYNLYLNGNPDGSATNVTQNFGNGSVAIGRFGAYNGGYFNGQIDEVAIFDEALTADQIKFDLYEPTALVGGVEKTADIENNTNLPTPVAWYRMGD